MVWKYYQEAEGKLLLDIFVSIGIMMMEVIGRNKCARE
jgi:hypothetical protein